MHDIFDSEFLALVQINRAMPTIVGYAVASRQAFMHVAVRVLASAKLHGHDVWSGLLAHFALPLGYWYDDGRTRPRW